MGAELIVPVEGVTRGDLDDTWGDARSQGRRHEGIDILAPQGTHVLAVADGRIVKFFQSDRGGHRRSTSSMHANASSIITRTSMRARSGSRKAPTCGRAM